MASKTLADIGKSANKFNDCKDDGYGTIACATAVGAEKVANLASVAGGAAIMATSTPLTVAGGAALAYNADTIGHVTKDAVLSFCEQDPSKVKPPVPPQQDVLPYLNVIIEDVQDLQDSVGGVQKDINRVKQDIKGIQSNVNEIKQTQQQFGKGMDDVKQDTFDIKQSQKETTKAAQMSKAEILAEITKIHASTQDAKQIQQKVHTLAQSQNAKISIIMENYDMMHKKSCRMSPETTAKYNSDPAFKRENDKLEQMIGQNKSAKEITDQHEVTMKTIKDNNDATAQLNSFTSNLSVCGEVGSCIANLYGRPKDAQKINMATSSAITLTTIGAAYSGYGALACMNPYALGALAVVTVINCAMAMDADSGESPFIGVFSMLTAIMESIADLKRCMLECFQKLGIKLDKMEANIIAHIAEHFDLSYETQCVLRQLCADTLKFHDYMTTSIESVNSNISSLKDQLTQQEAKLIVTNVGNLIAEIFVNLDITKVTEYSNKLTGKLTHPYEATNTALVGAKGVFTPSSISSLSISSLPSRKIYSNVKKYMFLREINVNSSVYVSQFMNSAQIISKMFDIRRNVNNCLMFHSFYNEFLQSEATIGLFCFEVEASSIILAISKEESKCDFYTYGPISLTTDIKLVGLLLEHGYGVRKIYKQSNDEVEVLRTLVHLTKRQTITRMDDQEVEADTGVAFMQKLPSLVDTEYEDVNYTLYTSIAKALMLTKVNQYTPRSADDEQFIRISDNEMNQIFAVAYTLQKNIQSVNMLANPEIFKNLCSGAGNSNSYSSTRTALTHAITEEFTKQANIELAKLTDPFINGPFLEMTTCSRFDEELSVTRDAMNWWCGYKWCTNDRRCGEYSHGTSGNFRGGDFNNYEEAVRSSAKSFRKTHLAYIERSKKEVRDNKFSPTFRTTYTNIVDYNEKFINQLPFFVYPKTGTGIVLPLYEKMREEIAKKALLLATIKKFNKMVFNKLGKYEMNYRLTDANEFTLLLYFKATDVNDRHVWGQEDIATKAELLTAHNWICVVTTSPITMSTVFGGVQLDKTKTEALWTWWCGGECASGQSKSVIENHGSNIPGNWWYEDVHVPTWSTRPPIADDAGALTKLTTFTEAQADVRKGALIENFVGRDHGQIYLAIIRNMFTTTANNPVSPALNKYFSAVKAIETYDHFTYQKLEPADIKIRSSGDIVTEIFNKYTTSLPSLTSTFNEIPMTAIETRYSTAAFVGDAILVSCLKEITQITEMFGSYITKGLSTPDIVKNMMSHVNNLYTSHKQLLDDIQKTTVMNDDDRVAEINRIVEQYTKNLGNLGDANNRLT